MNKLIEVIKKIATEMIFNKTTKEKMIKNLNAKVDIPLISEKTEKEFIESLYNAFEEAITERSAPPQFGMRYAFDPDEFAEGGVTDTDVALVGEKGPELAMFPIGTHILPLGKAKPADI